jgi:hypothetical protein
LPTTRQTASATLIGDAGCLAQLVEHRPYKARVAGSIPAAPTTKGDSTATARKNPANADPARKCVLGLGMAQGKDDIVLSVFWSGSSVG